MEPQPRRADARECAGQSRPNRTLDAHSSPRSMIVVTGFIDPRWRVEIEADAVLDEG